jgi:hypothetical protein
MSQGHTEACGACKACEANAAYKTPLPFASVRRNARGRGPLPVRRNAEPVLALLAMQGTPLGVGPFNETPNPSDGTPNPCEACEACGMQRAVFRNGFNGARIIDHVMITVISYIGILSAFLIAATVMYLGLVKIKLI